jgi:hypothetical protein
LFLLIFLLVLRRLYQPLAKDAINNIATDTIEIILVQNRFWKNQTGSVVGAALATAPLALRGKPCACKRADFLSLLNKKGSYYTPLLIEFNRC